MDDNQDIQLERPVSMFQRIFLGIAGFFCIAITTFELRQAIFQPGWWSLFILVIIVGAWSVGGMFIVAAIAGDGQSWHLRGGELTIHRRFLHRQTTRVIRREDIERTEIREVEWDSRGNSFCVVLRLKDGARFETPDYETRAAAEALEGRMLKEFGLARSAGGTGP